MRMFLQVISHFFKAEFQHLTKKNENSILIQQTAFNHLPMKT